MSTQLQTAAAHLGDGPVDGPCREGYACLADQEPSSGTETGRGATSVPAGCCAFFAFAITVDHRGVALEVRAPEDAGDLVTALFGAVA